MVVEACTENTSAEIQMCKLSEHIHINAKQQGTDGLPHA